jgi:hypothetical protein
MSDKRQRRWYQFSLGTMLIVLTLFGTVIGATLAWRTHREYCLRMASNYARQQGWTSAIAVNGNETSAELEALQAASRLNDQDRDKRYLSIEQAYRRAVWLPWEKLWIEDAPLDIPIQD